MTKQAVIVDAVRTPIGKRYGSLSGWHPAELAGAVLRELGERTAIGLDEIDDVIMGCLTQIGPQAMNIGRNAVLAAGWPVTIPATTVDRQCGSSQQAIHFAAQAVMSGTADVVVAAGVECMTTVPMFSNAPGGDPRAVYGDQIMERFADQENFGHTGLLPQGLCAEMVADRWGFTRAELDAYSLRSHQRAATARDAGWFDGETFEIARKVRDRATGDVAIPGDTLRRDEPIRDTSLSTLGELHPAFVDDGVITAGNASQIVDGAAAVLVMSQEKAEALGMRPLAVIRQLTVVGDDPVIMLTGPIPATGKALASAGLTASDVDLYEVNEAFACVVLAWLAEMGVDPEAVNVNGGGISLGHPLGASGARLTTTLVHELRRRGGGLGLQTMCESGGLANAMILEVPGA